MVAHSFEAADETQRGPVSASFVEVIATEVTVGPAGGQDLESGDDDLVGDGASGSARSAARLDAMIFVAQIGVLGAPGGDRRSVQSGLEMAVALAGADAPVLSGTLVIAGATPAQADRRAGVPNRVISIPCSASIVAATAQLTPGMVISRRWCSR